MDLKKIAAILAILMLAALVLMLVVNIASFQTSFQKRNTQPTITYTAKTEPEPNAGTIQANPIPTAFSVQNPIIETYGDCYIAGHIYCRPTYAGELEITVACNSDKAITMYINKLEHKTKADPVGKCLYQSTSRPETVEQGKKSAWAFVRKLYPGTECVEIRSEVTSYKVACYKG